MDDAAKVRKLLRQQSAIATFGSFALRQSDLLKVLNEAARVCADGLSAPFCKVCRFRPAENDLFIEAGYGWQPGVVGVVVSRADSTSPQGNAFRTGLPAICRDLRAPNKFDLPGFYAAHRVVSTIDVPIKGADQPYGVLEVDSDKQQDYDRHDIDFLTGFANVLAEAVATSTRTTILRSTIEQMKALVEDKDRILEQKKVLAEEFQHRVRNNLQLVYGMLSQQLSNTRDSAGRRGLAGIARRVFTLAQIYDHLDGAEFTRTTDFGRYVRSLCADLAEFHTDRGRTTKLVCDTDTLMLDLDVVTALGIVITELVTNSFEHAFPSGEGTTTVILRAPPGVSAATIVITDSGAGFEIDPNSKRHGLGLVGRLLTQVGATAAVNTDAGTRWTINVPLRTALAPLGDLPTASTSDDANGSASATCERIEADVVEGNVL